MTLVDDFNQGPPLENILRTLQERVDNVVSRVATHAHAMGKHEPHLTSQLAHAIHDAIASNPIEAEGLKVEVYVEEFKPTEESENGADLYISIVRHDTGIPTSKGMLVQSKRRKALDKTEERRRLRNQSYRMRQRSPTGSYLWVFEEDGVTCVPAPKSSDPVIRGHTYDPQTVGELLADGLRCDKGDKKIGRNVDRPVAEGLRSRMKHLSAPIGLGIDIRTELHRVCD